MDNNYFYSKTFRDKLERKLDEPIIEGSNTTFRQLSDIDEAARNSMRESQRRRYKIEREKKFKKKVLMYGAFGVLSLMFVCCQIKQSNDQKRREELGGPRIEIGHNGEVYEAYDDGEILPYGQSRGGK